MQSALLYKVSPHRSTISTDSAAGGLGLPEVSARVFRAVDDPSLRLVRRSCSKIGQPYQEFPKLTAFCLHQEICSRQCLHHATKRSSSVTNSSSSSLLLLVICRKQFASNLSKTCCFYKGLVSRITACDVREVCGMMLPAAK